MTHSNRLLLLMLTLQLALLTLPSCGGKKHKPHILLITIDTLRRDHLGSYGYPRSTSPFMDSLAKKGVRFELVVTPMPLTCPSHASILTSLHPLTHGVLSNAFRLDRKVETIGEVLQANGYYTIGTVAAKILADKYHFDQGFDSFSVKWDKNIDRNEIYERTATSVNRSLFQQVNEYLADKTNNKKSLFIWVHYFDPHWEYLEHDDISFNNKLPDQDQENRKPMRRYDKEIRFLDGHIQELLRFLEDIGIGKRLITCLTADHGEMFGEHGIANCHVDFYSETTLVPLIFKGYGIPKNKTVDTLVSTMDIGTTLLAMAGLTFSSPTEGIDLMQVLNKPKARRFINRDFLVLGNPDYTRSLQLIRYPHAYILNADNHYKHWYVFHDSKSGIPFGQFKPVPRKMIRENNNHINVDLPRPFRRGLFYSVLKGEVKSNSRSGHGSGLAAKLKVTAAPPLIRVSKRIKIPPGVKSFLIIFPTTVLDDVSIDLGLYKGTQVKNLQYAYISKKELHLAGEPAQKIKSSIFKAFPTLRKRKGKNEFFDLSNDIQMAQDLVAGKKAKKFLPDIIKYRKLIYALFKYYSKKKDKLLKGVNTSVRYTPEEKEMLKSLGYL